MLNKSIVKFSLMIFALILTGNLGTFAQKIDCSKTTDDEIVIAIYDKIKVKYADEINHVNVRISEGVVTIEGWATSKKAIKEIVKFAEKTDCVKKVVNELSEGKGGGCGPGTKECGGICIPEKEACNVCLSNPGGPGCAQQNPKEPRDPKDDKDTKEPKKPAN